MDWLEPVKQVLGVGVDAKELSVIQVCARGSLVFVAAIVLVRFADRRFLAKMSAFDVILGFVLASMLSRAVNGSSPLLPTLAGGVVLVLLHRAVAALAFHLHWFGVLVKGSAHELVQDGRPVQTALRAEKISPQDLLEEARLQGRVDEVSKIQCAFLERSGEVSVIPKKEAG